MGGGSYNFQIFLVNFYFERQSFKKMGGEEGKIFIISLISFFFLFRAGPIFFFGGGGQDYFLWSNIFFFGVGQKKKK